MKKSILLPLLIVSALAGCSNNTDKVTGTYKGGYYEISVEVKVKNNLIDDVKIIGQESNASPENIWPETKLWSDNKANSLTQLKGKSVAEIKKLSVSYNPTTDEVSNDTEYQIAGATRSQTRLILAVQNALTKIV